MVSPSLWTASLGPLRGISLGICQPAWVWTNGGQLPDSHALEFQLNHILDMSLSLNIWYALRFIEPSRFGFPVGLYCWILCFNSAFPFLEKYFGMVGTRPDLTFSLILGKVCRVIDLERCIRCFKCFVNISSFLNSVIENGGSGCELLSPSRWPSKEDEWLRGSRLYINMV